MSQDLNELHKTMDNGFKEIEKRLNRMEVRQEARIEANANIIEMLKRIDWKMNNRK